MTALCTATNNSSQVFVMWWQHEMKNSQLRYRVRSEQERAFPPFAPVSFQCTAEDPNQTITKQPLVGLRPSTWKNDPNCKVETVYVVVSRTKRPNGVTVKYDKRITICTIEDVPADDVWSVNSGSALGRTLSAITTVALLAKRFAGTELCFNYQMTQYNIGCPLPDCKCGAPNCTGTLGSIAHEKAESDVSSNDVQKPKKKKQKRKAVSSLDSPEKKKSGVRSRQSTPASSTPPLSRSPRKDQKATVNGRKSMPTVTFRRSSLPSKVEPSQVLRSQLHRPANRGCKVLNGSKEPTSNNMDDAKLKRALLNGEWFPESTQGEGLYGSKGLVFKSAIDCMDCKLQTLLAGLFFVLCLIERNPRYMRFGTQQIFLTHSMKIEPQIELFQPLEKISDSGSSPKSEVRKTTNGLRKTRKIAAELPSVNLIVS
ncbi:hypothetical protein Y032_0575g197 [Ancylostoma ceylanicum]|uniref:Post-SET domain-containing protein n=1 Tax=Ancylostoma ceylanicum TaxID=53326 RepID=A0A016WNU4_9BILA|nr:hypothetical protein Y032_0575g197 [Ancylostoma ceylanicum]